VPLSAVKFWKVEEPMAKRLVVEAVTTFRILAKRLVVVAAVKLAFIPQRLVLVRVVMVDEAPTTDSAILAKTDEESLCLGAKPSHVELLEETSTCRYMFGLEKS
jgi:hypothetical protein